MKEQYVTAEDIEELYGINKATIVRYSSPKYCRVNKKKQFPKPIVKGHRGQKSIWNRADVYLWKVELEEERYSSIKSPIKSDIPKVIIPYWPLPKCGLVEL